MRPIRNAVTIVVDGREVTAPEGSMLVDAAKQGDVEIPVFCYEPKLGHPVGACRMCLVEVEGIPKLQTACSTPIRDGMVVHTQTDQVKAAQNSVVEFLLVNHPLDCPVCDKGGECPLQDVAMGWGPGRSRVTDPKRHFQKPLELSPLIAIDRERCILCYRCVRFSQEVAEDEQLQLLERGDRTYVGTFDDRPYVGPFHGNIIDLCPVGALTSYTYRFRARPWDIEDAGSICTLCPSQCNVLFTVRDEGVVRVQARDNHDVDDGWLCDKGRFGFEMIAAEERITEPLVRKGGALQPASWTEAIEAAAAGLRRAGERTAAILAGGASNEEGYLVQRILRQALGSPNVDSRPAGRVDLDLLQELARPDLTARMSEIDFADAILVLDCDPLHAAPILDLRIRKAVRLGGAALAVASSRPTALDGGAKAVARFAPGDAGALTAALAGALGAAGHAADGPYAEQASELADALRRADDVVIVWGDRLARAGRAAIEALLAIAGALEVAEHHGSGLLEVPDTTNARGLREVGCLPNVGPGLADPPGAGLDTDRMASALESGELAAAVLFEADPVRDFPGGPAWHPALGAADFVLAVATFPNESTTHADVVLPAETHAEKDGTVTHPDGRLQRLRPGIPHPGETRMGWQWLCELSAALGHETGLQSGPEVLAAIASEVPFYAGITHDEIGGEGIRWQDRPQAAASRRGPAPTHRAAAAERGSAPLPPGGRSPAPRGDQEPSRIAPDSALEQRGQAPSNGALRLGTYRDIWSGEVPERNPSLKFLEPKQRLEVSPADAERLGLESGDKVKVGVNGTSVEAIVALRERIQQGTCFMIEATAESNPNALANGAVPLVEVTKVAE